MIKIKEESKKSLMGKTLMLASLSLITLSLFSVKVNAIGSHPGSPGTSKLDPIGSTTTGITTKMKFNSLGSTQKSWYEKDNSNMVFFEGYKGFTWYSPVSFC